MDTFLYFAREKRTLSRRICGILFAILVLCSGVLSQSSPPSSAASPQASEHSRSSAPLRKGANEFGLWSGYSPFSFVFKGTIKDHQLFLVNLQYARTLVGSRPVTLKYVAEIVPIALQFQPKQRFVVDGKKLLVNPAATIYGAGTNPIGVQANFGDKKIQPFAGGSLGFLYFKQQVPVQGASQFNYNIAINFGAQFFPRAGRSFSVGWKYDHLSNHYQAHLNPGLDSGVFYVGFSLVRRKSER